MFSTVNNCTRFQLLLSIFLPLRCCEHRVKFKNDTWLADTPCVDMLGIIRGSTKLWGNIYSSHVVSAAIMGGHPPPNPHPNYALSFYFCLERQCQRGPTVEPTVVSCIHKWFVPQVCKIIHWQLTKTLEFNCNITNSFAIDLAFWITFKHCHGVVNILTTPWRTQQSWKLKLLHVLKLKAFSENKYLMSVPHVVVDSIILCTS